MQTKEFNVLPLIERNKLVFREGKLNDIFGDNKFQKVFYYKLNELKIDVIFDKSNNRILDIIAWENSSDRVDFLKMPAKIIIPSPVWRNGRMVVYILQCSDGTFYVGTTNDLEKRVAKHNAGKGAKYTRGRTPVKICYSLSFESRSEACKHEYILKRYSRNEKLDLIREP